MKTLKTNWKNIFVGISASVFLLGGLFFERNVSGKINLISNQLENKGSEGALEILNQKFPIGESHRPTASNASNSVYLRNQTITHSGSFQFGSSVAISGDRAIVGAPLENSNLGRVYIFKRDGSDWVLEEDFTASVTTGVFGFGWSVDIDGNRVIVGAPNSTVGGLSERGKAYIYTFSSGTWHDHEEPLTNTTDSGDGGGEYFGRSVSIDGTRVIVGSDLDKTDNTSPPKGSATVYELVGSVWTVLRSKIPGPSGGDSFGVSVSISGDRVAIGATNYTSGGKNGRGAVFFYHLGAMAWDLEDTILGTDASDELGGSVEIKGDTAVAGSAGGSPADVFVVNRSSTTWTPTLLSTPPTGPGLGTAVSLDGDTIVIGTNSNVKAYAYVYRGSGSSWSYKAIITGPAATQDNFGRAVGVDGDKIIVGAYADLSDQGTASIFINTAPRVADFDGDGESDVSVWRPSNGVWYTTNSAGGSIVEQWGTSGDKLVPGDYNGDGRTDFAIWREVSGSGYWYIQPNVNSSPSPTPASYNSQFGQASDIPVQGDYDGDGITDLAVWRPSNGIWYVTPSSSPSPYTSTQWGQNGDTLVQGDYDGDGRTDLAVWRLSGGYGYYYINSSSAFSSTPQLGETDDEPVPGDYDGDGKTDLAVYRASTGYWYLYKSTAPSTLVSTSFGVSGAIPVPADYDGDGKMELAYWLPSNGCWYIYPNSTTCSSSGTGNQLGASGDIPIPIKYIASP